MSKETLTTGNKNLQQIANEFNLYTYNTMSEEYKNIYDNRLNEYCKKPKFETPKFFIDNPLFEVGVFFECKVQDEGTDKEHKYIEHNYTLVKYVNCDIIFMLNDIWSKKGKFVLTMYYGYFNKFNKISNSLRNEAIKELQEPQQIGVFTEKKVLAWVNYGIEYLTKFEALLLNVESKNVENEKVVNDFINSLGDKATVKKWDNGTQKNFYIQTKLFYVSFTIHLDSNYLEKSIRYEGDLNDIINITSKL